MKRYTLLLSLAIAFLIGGYISYTVFSQKETIIETESTILLERVRKVCKLVTVEGDFMERYTEKNIRPITLYLPFATTLKFPKEASILVRGKVMVGYDMEGINITMNTPQKKVVIRNLPEPSILGIDHEIEYENLDESYFNTFTKEDYTQLAKNAKTALQNKALEGKLLDEAKIQGNDMLEIVRSLVTSAGWTLEIDQDYDVEQLLN